MKRMAIGFAMSCFVIGLAAQAQESNITLTSRIQASGQELLPEIPANTALITSIDPATEEPIYTERIVPPPTPGYIANWGSGGFLLAAQANPALCARIYTKPTGSDTLFYVGTLRPCKDWNTTRWLYNDTTKQLSPNLAGDGRCMSTYPSGSVRRLGLFPCSNPDSLYHNKKWRFTDNGTIVNATNPLLCLSVDGGLLDGSLLRIHNCANTNMRWITIPK